MGSKGILFVLPVVTLVLGIAIGKWWSDRDHEVSRASKEDSGEPRHTAAVPSMLSHGSPSGGARTDAAAEEAKRERDALLNSIPSTKDTAAPWVAPATSVPGKDSPAAPDVKKPVSPNADGPEGEAERAKPSAEDAGAAQMLGVLFTNPMFRGQFVKQMVAQVNESVKFTPAQQESAGKELESAMKPLIDAFSSTTKPDMKDLEPKFNAVKDDWKRRLTPLLTSEQAAAFQDWLDQHHSLSIKMGVDEKGQPKDPEGK